MKEAHKTLWLQWEGDGEGEVTWCQDAINEDDIEYIRADIVQAQLAALAWARWISVDERLPEEAEMVLVSWTSDQHIMRARYHEGPYPWLVIGRGYVNDIQFWMPLPPAPAREETP